MPMTEASLVWRYLVPTPGTAPVRGGAEKVRRHQRERGAGIHVIEHHGENRPRKALFGVLHIGAIPFRTADVEPSAQIRRHRHKAAVRPGHRHFLGALLFREPEHQPMGILIRAAHHIVAFAEQMKHIVHRLDAALHIDNARLDHILLGEIQEIQTHFNSLLIINRYLYGFRSFNLRSIPAIRSAWPQRRPLQTAL